MEYVETPDENAAMQVPESKAVKCKTVTQAADEICITERLNATRRKARGYSYTATKVPGILASDFADIQSDR